VRRRLAWCFYPRRRRERARVIAESRAWAAIRQDDYSIVETAARLSGFIKLLRRSNSHAINHVVDQRVALC
jgi:hypothetical protein